MDFKAHERWTVPIAIAVVLVLIQTSAGVLIVKQLPTWQERGTFGDMFGAVNALFSGLALAGVIYAIVLQRQELALQRDELRLTRAELERAAQAQEMSQRALAKQAESLQLAAKINLYAALTNAYAQDT